MIELWIRDNFRTSAISSEIQILGILGNWSQIPQ